VRDLAREEERTAAAQLVDDRSVGLLDPHPGEPPRRLGERPAPVHRREDLEAVFQADLVILVAVPRGDMDEAGALFERHVVGEDHGRTVPRERMGGDRPLEIAAAADAHNLRRRLAQLVGHPARELPGHDEKAPLHPDRGVLELGPHGDGAVCGERPGRRGPDEQGGAARPGERLLDAGDGLERHVDRRRGVVVVLDLRLGEGGLAGRAPVDRLHPAVDVSVEVHPAEAADDGGLVGGVEREVRPLPVAEDAEPLELLPLDVDEPERVVARLLPEPRPVDLVLAHLELLHQLVLDGKAVAVPAGDEGAVKPAHRLVLHDHVLEELVEGVPHMDVAVGVGGAVVEDERPAALPVGQRLLVDPLPLPECEQLRLPQAQGRLHREGGSGKVQRALVVVRVHTAFQYGEFHAGRIPAAVRPR